MILFLFLQHLIKKERRNGKEYDALLSTYSHIHVLHYDRDNGDNGDDPPGLIYSICVST